MKILVLGANGRTGCHLVRLALKRGDTVSAVVRSEEKRPDIQHDDLTVLVGDPCDANFLSDVFHGHDAVVSALGGRRPTKAATSVYPLSASAIVKAAHNTGVERILVTSSALLFPRRSLMEKILPLIVPNIVSNATRMEEILRDSPIRWTVARCGFLTDKEETEYRAEQGKLPTKGSSVSRQSLAHFLIDAVQRSETTRQVFGVSAPAR